MARQWLHPKNQRKALSRTQSPKTQEHSALPSAPDLGGEAMAAHSGEEKAVAQLWSLTSCEGLVTQCSFSNEASVSSYVSWGW